VVAGPESCQAGFFSRPIRPPGWSINEFPYDIPQRQLSLLVRMAELVRAGKSQFVGATHSPVLLTFPDADIVSFDVAPLRSVRLQDTSHYQITRGILEDPQSYWRHLLKKDDD